MMSASGVTHARRNAIRFLPSVSCRRATLANFSTSGPSIAATGVTGMLPLASFMSASVSYAIRSVCSRGSKYTKPGHARCFGGFELADFQRQRTIPCRTPYTRDGPAPRFVAGFRVQW